MDLDYEFENMTDAIEAFKEASDHIKSKERHLDLYVESFMKKNPTIEELRELTFVLPRDYKGVRRVYETIIRMEATNGN